MNVRELMNILVDLPEDMVVLLSQDSEGNGFSPLSDVEQHLYRPNERTPWYIEDIYMTNEQLDEAIASGKAWYTEEDRAPDDAIPAVILWPVN